jgi:hypothetical protein
LDEYINRAKYKIRLLIPQKGKTKGEEKHH